MLVVLCKIDDTFYSHHALKGTLKGFFSLIIDWCVVKADSMCPMDWAGTLKGWNNQIARKISMQHAFWRTVFCQRNLISLLFLPLGLQNYEQNILFALSSVSCIVRRVSFWLSFTAWTDW